MRHVYLAAMARRFRRNKMWLVGTVILPMMLGIIASVAFAAKLVQLQ